jgi:hypothetical protein
MPDPSSLVLLLAALLGPPAVGSLSPSSAAAGGGGFTLTVAGTEFRRNAVVLWNGDARPTIWVSETRLQATIGAADIALPGSVEVRVLTRGAKGGRSAPAAFTVTGTAIAATAPANPVPAVSSLAPSTALAGADAMRLIVTGGGFAAGATVQWNGASRPTTRHSSTEVSAVIPGTDLAAVGSARVTVLNPSPGGGSSAELVMRILHAAPVVSSLTPATVVAGGGDLTIAIAGQNFIRGAQVQWNNLARPTTFVGPTTLRVSVPAADLRSAGAAQVTVVTTVGQSAMRSAPVQFVIGLPPQIVVTATPQLEISRFYVGGEANPAWVTAGRPAPLHALVNGVAPTHYRAGENAQLSGAQWQAAGSALSYTFPAGTTGPRTLWLQFRFGDGSTATLSGIASDAVEVVPPYSTAGLSPEYYGAGTSERVRLECTPGQVMTGVHGASGLWLDNVGLVCADRKGGFAYTAIYGGLGAPASFDVRCPLGSAPGELGLFTSGVWSGFLGKPVTACPQTPPGIGQGFDVARAVAVAGERETFEEGVHCPAGAFPVGLDVYLSRLPVTGQRGVSALGLLCARLRE